MGDVMLIVLKNTQQILCEVDTSDRNKEDGLICRKPLLIGWQADPKRKGVVLALSEYPALIVHLVENVGTVKIDVNEIRTIYSESDIKPEVKADYDRRKQEVYGGISLVYAMPTELKGRA